MDLATERRLLAQVTRSARSTHTQARWPMRLWIPAFAAAAVFIVTVAILRRAPGSLPTPQRQGAPEGQVAATRPSSFVLALDQPDVKLTQTALVLRSAGSDGRFVDDIAPALNAYRAHDYAEADRRFAAVKPQYPKSVELSFYHAIVRLFLNDAAGAIASLQSARRLDDGSFAPEISWYLAVAYERAGESVRARAELDTLCRRSSAFSKRACEAAPKLAPQ
jgi:predicted Zn-dependent protease